jgi:hypothetical protein
MSRKDDMVFTETSKGTWFDYDVDPNRIASYRRDISFYTYPDFLTLILSNGYHPSYGEYGPVNPRDPFQNCWNFFSTEKPDAYPWPDQLNTQTWWVKMPSSRLRAIWNQAPDDQRNMRGEALTSLTPNAVSVLHEESGYWYGYLPEYDVVVDISGHAISMLIMAGQGVVDIIRYWDTVGAMLGQSLTTGKKNRQYLELVKAGRVTEDATVHPFKLWHTVWDYWGALYAYVQGAKEMKYPINVWVVRATYTRLKEIEVEFPQIKTFKRKELRSRVLPLLRP